MNANQPGFCPWCPSDGTNCGMCECEMREMASLRQIAQNAPGREIYRQRAELPTRRQSFSGYVILACATALIALTLAKIAGF